MKGLLHVVQTALYTHRFPSVIILCAVRMYLRYQLFYQDVADLPAERGLDIDRSTVIRWVQKFGPELSKRAERHRSRASEARSASSTRYLTWSPEITAPS